MGLNAALQAKQARRLYVGNLPPDVTEIELQEFFNEQYVGANLCAPDAAPILSVQINREKNYAFLEVAEPEDADKGMAFDGITLRGSAMKVRRPKDYQVIENAQAGLIPGIISTNVPDTPNKIFIGGLPSSLNEEQVKEIVLSFGPLKAFNLVRDTSTSNSKGYAFLEYADASVTDKACEGLNGMELLGKSLLVQRAHIGAKNQTMYQAQLAASAKPPSNTFIANLLNPSVPITSSLNASGKLKAIHDVEPSRVLLLLNLINVNDLTVPDKVAFYKEDIRVECEQFGKVNSIYIPTLEKEGQDKPYLTSVFVEFEDAEMAKKTQEALQGRKYNYRCVLTSYYDADKFAKRDFSDPERDSN